MKMNIFLVLVIVVVLASIGYQYSQCDGIFVRTLFGFECIL